MKFGVREICDVVFKAKKSGSLGNYNYSVGQPVLYIDSAKTSTIEGAASTVYATGGRGNSRLIAWEGEKTLTFTVEDALLSEKGLAILTGAGLFNLSKTYEHKLKITSGKITAGKGVYIAFAAQTVSFKSNRNIQYTDLYELLKNEYLLCNFGYIGDSEKIFRKDCLVLKGTLGEELWLAADYANEVAIGRIWSEEQPADSFTTLKYFFEVDQISLQDVFEQGDFPLYTITINNPVRVHHIEKTVMHLAISEDNDVQGAYIDNLPAGKGAISTTSPCFVVQTDENGSFIRAFKGLEVTESIRIQDYELVVIAPTEELSSVAKYFEPGEYKVPVFVDYYTEEKPSVTQFIIDAQNFAGYYYVEATTDFRRAADGKDVKAMITFPNVKVQSNFTFNMAASGDPSTFSFVMDAMPGYTLNRPNKKVLCEMEIVDDVVADSAIKNNDSVWGNAVQVNKEYSITEEFSIKPFTVPSGREDNYAMSPERTSDKTSIGTIPLVGITYPEDKNKEAFIIPWYTSEGSEDGLSCKLTLAGVTLRIYKPYYSTEEQANMIKSINFNAETQTFSFNTEQELEEYTITQNDEQPLWKIASDAKITFSNADNLFVM